MSAALIAAVFAKSVSAALPAELLSTTASAGNLVLRGVPLESVVSAQAAAVVRNVLAGFTSLGKLSAAAFLASGSIALAIAVIAWQLQADVGPRSPGAMLQLLDGHELRSVRSRAGCGALCGRQVANDHRSSAAHSA